MPDRPPGANGGLASGLHGEATGTSSHSGIEVEPGPIGETTLEGLFSGGFLEPLNDPKARAAWPTLQLCMRSVLTREGKPRAGGEVKTVASGASYVSTLTMPEEGRSLRVVHDLFSDAWNALEHALMSKPIPWVQCSDFALRRAKIKKGKESPKLLAEERRSG